jgi:hypothetical protein
MTREEKEGLFIGAALTIGTVILAVVVVAIARFLGWW